MLIHFTFLSKINIFSTGYSFNCATACGFRENQKQTVDGVYVQPNQFPWVVGAYVIANHDKTIFKCSGALISKKHTLFSAYCTTLVSDWWPRVEVRFGINRRSTLKRGVIRFHTHENYKNGNSDFNIAVWNLDENVVFGLNIQPICLPRSVSFDYAGKIALAVGWYDDEYERKRYFAPTSMTTFVSASKSHRVRAPIWTNEECAELYNTRRITNDMICAGEYENGVRHACMKDVS